MMSLRREFAGLETRGYRTSWREGRFLCRFISVDNAFIQSDRGSDEGSISSGKAAEWSKWEMFSDHEWNGAADLC